MDRQTLLVMAGAFLLVVGTAHATMVSVSVLDYTGVTPAFAQFTLDPETIAGDDAFSCELAIAGTGDDEPEALDFAGTTDLPDNGSNPQVEFNIAPVAPNALDESIQRIILGSGFTLLSITFQNAVLQSMCSGCIWGGSSVLADAAPEPNTLLLAGVALIAISLIGRRRRQQ